MPMRQRHKWFLKEWRRKRGLSQEELGALVGLHKGDISNYELGKRRYNQDILEKLSDALAITPAELLERNPNDGKSLWSIWEQASEAERDDIRRLAEVVVSKSKAEPTPN